ncbi:amino acid adenylation domain-containing protein [Streptomyces sp. SF28]|nr:non-ribosomal peptide synthetase [Streptomyces pinistramenti]MCB5906084.1 amino acid adenylation domain-containing protein [Streptomyces pinistramenti]
MPQHTSHPVSSRFPAPPAAVAPSSFPQQRMWFLSQLPGAGEAYNEAMAFRLRGPLDRHVLGRTLDALVRRHETLRSRLAEAGGEVVQYIDPPGTGFALVVEDLTGRADAEEHLAARQREELTTPFDLRRGPLGRARLLVLGERHHVLLLTMHHSVFDGWSMEVLYRELGLLYAASVSGIPDPLPEPVRQYADYARAQRAEAAGEEFAAQAAYWQQQLAGAPALLPLPADRPRPPEQDHHGGRVSFCLDEELTAALRSVARKSGGTLFVAVLTGWSVLLARLTGQSDIVVGTPTANRGHGDTKGLIGFFVNSLPLRVDLSGTPTAAAALKRVRGVVRGALDHQDLPFERIVELVNPPRSPAHTPLFQTMCAWVSDQQGMLTLPDIDVQPLDIPDAAAKFDLALSVTETDGRVVGHLDYACALFDRATVERYAGHLRNLLTAMAEWPGTGIADLPLMDEEETRRLVADWDAGRPAAVLDASDAPDGLVRRFDDQVRLRPDAPALVCGDVRHSYAELDLRANRLAHALAARGAGPGQVVGVHAGRTAELVVGILGILKAGAAWLPLDPGQPAARLAAMAEDAAPALVLSDADDPPGPWPSLRAVEAEATREDAPDVRIPASQPAYVIYTSGSTGRPKGVAVPHTAVLNLFDTWLARMGAEPGEASSAWSGIGFDASVHELLLPLTTGGTLHLVPDDLRGDPEALLAWMREHRIGQAFLPPAYVKWIDEDPARRLAGLRLRRLLTGVESLPEMALYRLTQHLPGLRVCYGYGPTEATLYSTAYYDPQPLERQCPIGRPLPGTRMYLLDDRLRPVPAGVAGEVYLGGAGLAQGYLHRPDLTEERFIADPFVPGERLYRTGDLARRLPDGNAEYLGRSDDQVKLRGFRIEPGEVEAAVLALDGVREAAVFADRDTDGQLRLVAGIGRGDAPPRLPHEWRALLAARLPDYMIPALFVEVPSLPLNRSGKLDRAALVERARAAATTQVNVAGPRDHIELSLYQMWQEILLTEDIGISDSFFDLGGTSLSAIKMAHGVRERLGETVAVRDIMLHPTIEDLGGLIRRGAAGRPASNLIAFRAGSSGRRVVCVHPGGGTAFCYLSLAKVLPDSVGLYGIQSPGVNPGESFLPSVEAMAEAYLRLIEPLGDGPLVLTGLSYGGLVAHEMGRRLADAGRTGVSVVLLDTQATDDPAERAAVTPVDMAEFRDKLVRFNGMYPGIDDEQIEQYFRIYNHNRMTAREHVPARSAARLVLLQAAGGGADEAFLDAVRTFWHRRAGGGYHVEPVDCGHWEMLENTEAPLIAAVLERELERCAPPPVTRPAQPDATAPVREAR